MHHQALLSVSIVPILTNMYAILPPTPLEYSDKLIPNAQIAPARVLCLLQLSLSWAFLSMYPTTHTLHITHSIANNAPYPNMHTMSMLGYTHLHMQYVNDVIANERILSIWCNPRVRAHPLEYINNTLAKFTLWYGCDVIRAHTHTHTHPQVPSHTLWFVEGTHVYF